MATACITCTRGDGRRASPQAFFPWGSMPRPEPGDALRAAAERGDVATVLSELSKGSADIDAAGSKTGLSALHRASERGRVEVAKVLLQHGATVDRPSKTGQGPLHLAAGRGRLEICRILLDAGADPLMADNNGWQALHTAAARNHTLVAQLIARRGGNPRQVDTAGCHVAAAVPLLTLTLVSLVAEQRWHGTGVAAAPVALQSGRG